VSQAVCDKSQAALIVILKTSGPLPIIGDNSGTPSLVVIFQSNRPAKAIRDSTEETPGVTVAKRASLGVESLAQLPI
jgi:hypothetical protein